MTGNLHCWLTRIPVFVVNTLFPLLPWFEASDLLVLRWLFKTGRNTYLPGERHDALLCFIQDTDTSDQPMLSLSFFCFFKWNHLYFVWFSPSPARPLVGPTTWNSAPNWRSAGSQTQVWVIHWEYIVPNVFSHVAQLVPHHRFLFWGTLLFLSIVTSVLCFWCL